MTMMVFRPRVARQGQADAGIAGRALDHGATGLDQLAASASEQQVFARPGP
jgi:hypothetical protein